MSIADKYIGYPIYSTHQSLNILENRLPKSIICLDQELKIRPVEKNSLSLKTYPFLQLNYNSYQQYYNLIFLLRNKKNSDMIVLLRKKKFPLPNVTVFDESGLNGHWIYILHYSVGIMRENHTNFVLDAFSNGLMNSLKIDKVFYEDMYIRNPFSKHWVCETYHHKCYNFEL